MMFGIVKATFMLICLSRAHSLFSVKFLTYKKTYRSRIRAVGSTMNEPIINNKCAISYATLDDVSSIVSCTNDAYVADAFFKKPEYHNRFTEDDVRQMIQATNSVFVIATDPQDISQDACPQSTTICGSLYLQWSTDASPSSPSSSGGFHIVGKFSAVAVRQSAQQKGVGRLLVRSAEEYILRLSTATAAIATTAATGQINGVSKASPTSLSPLISAELTMGVINLREDLFPWYEKQGFTVVGEMPWDAELARIIKEGYEHVCLIKMRKTLL